MRRHGHVTTRHVYEVPLKFLRKDRDEPVLGFWRLDQRSISIVREAAAQEIAALEVSSPTLKMYPRQQHDIFEPAVVGEDDKMSVSWTDFADDSDTGYTTVPERLPPQPSISNEKAPSQQATPHRKRHTAPARLPPTITTPVITDRPPTPPSDKQEPDSPTLNCLSLSIRKIRKSASTMFSWMTGSQSDTTLPTSSTTQSGPVLRETRRPVPSQSGSTQGLLLPTNPLPPKPEEPLQPSPPTKTDQNTYTPEMPVRPTCPTEGDQSNASSTSNIPWTKLPYQKTFGHLVLDSPRAAKKS
jgi:hypothetical protein